MTLEAIYDAKVDFKPHLLEIVLWPDERLHQPCEDIKIFDSEENRYLKQLTINMTFTMNKLDGVGLAAPQIGIPANMFILLVKERPMVFINPRLISSSDDMVKCDEGCLSIPGYFEKRERSNSIVVGFQSLKGDEREVELYGLWSFACQHELDHLNGKLFIDGASIFKRKRIQMRMKKFLKKMGQ
jgi:peptide deformylase